ncbi:hypothetical protein FTX61_21105 [Nitriliruptoraceae bacterium ZYF776]|nr:hypothetical protein [Profundirhabdus halotolerans]
MTSSRTTRTPSRPPERHPRTTGPSAPPPREVDRRARPRPAHRAVTARPTARFDASRTCWYRPRFEIAEDRRTPARRAEGRRRAPPPTTACEDAGAPRVPRRRLDGSGPRGPSPVAPRAHALGAFVVVGPAPDLRAEVARRASDPVPPPVEADPNPEEPWPGPTRSPPSLRSRNTSAARQRRC